MAASLDADDYVHRDIDSLCEAALLSIRTDPLPVDSSHPLGRDGDTCASIDNLTHIYQHLVGSLLFLQLCSRRDISFAVFLLFQFCSSLLPRHYAVARWVLAVSSNWTSHRSLAFSPPMPCFLQFLLFLCGFQAQCSPVHWISKMRCTLHHHIHSHCLSQLSPPALWLYHPTPVSHYINIFLLFFLHHFTFDHMTSHCSFRSHSTSSPHFHRVRSLFSVFQLSSARLGLGAR
jgi:hypothetical protein